MSYDSGSNYKYPKQENKKIGDPSPEAIAFAKRMIALKWTKETNVDTIASCWQAGYVHSQIDANKIAKEDEPTATLNKSRPQEEPGKESVQSNVGVDELKRSPGEKNFQFELRKKRYEAALQCDCERCKTIVSEYAAESFNAKNKEGDAVAFAKWLAENYEIEATCFGEWEYPKPRGDGEFKAVSIEQLYSEYIKAK